MRVLILGAGGGIGSALSRRLASEGARLLLAGRTADKLEALAEETGAEATVLDATAAEEVEGAVERVVEQWGGIDGAVNCVGSILLKPAHLTRGPEWQQVIDTNLSSAFYLLRAAAGAMQKQRDGSIVLVSSAAARTGLANHEAIGAAKAGIIGLARSAAASYASSGVRVNCVAPGLIRTPLTERITSSETALKTSLSLHPMGRAGEPEEVASAIAWLLAPDQGWVTGQVIGVDGGLADLKTLSRG